MPKVIWKFPFGLTSDIAIEMPVGAEVVAVGQQGVRGCLWAICDPSAGIWMREFTMVGTGMAYDDDLVHVGTWFDDSYVWHLLEAPR